MLSEISACSEHPNHRCTVKAHNEAVLICGVNAFLVCAGRPAGVVPASDEDASKGSLEETHDQIQRRGGTGLWWGSKVLISL